MKKILPNMVFLTIKQKDLIPSFCNFVNNNKDSLTNYQKGVVADYIISNVIGGNVKDLNSGIYNILKSYLISNIGDISFNLFGNSIREIILGDIKSGPLFSSNFSNEELTDRFFNGKNSNAVLPSKDNMKKLFVCYDEKNIFSNNLVRDDKDFKNVHIGEYYFNVNNVLSDVDNPYIFKFTTLYEDELQIEMLTFDKLGNFVDNDIYVDYLESSDGVNYKVVRQMHNEIEDIDKLHGKMK